MYSASIRKVRTGISFILYLLQGIDSCSIKFKLKYIYIVLCFYYAVATSLTLFFFSQNGIDAYHVQYKIKGIMEIALLFSFVFLSPNSIGNICRKRGEKMVQFIQVSIFESFHHLEDPTVRASFGFEITGASRREAFFCVVDYQ